MREIRDAADRFVGRSWQDIYEVVADRDPVPSAAFDDGQDRRHAWSSLWAASLEPLARPVEKRRMEFSAKLLLPYDTRRSPLFWRPVLPQVGLIVSAGSVLHLHSEGRFIRLDLPACD